MRELVGNFTRKLHRPSRDEFTTSARYQRTALEADSDLLCLFRRHKICEWKIRNRSQVAETVICRRPRHLKGNPKSHKSIPEICDIRTLAFMHHLGQSMLVIHLALRDTS